MSRQNYLHVLRLWGKDKAGRKLLLAWCLAPGCGRLTVVREDNFKKGSNTTSCGCLRKSASSKRSKAMWSDPERAAAVLKKMEENKKPRGRDRSARKARSASAGRKHEIDRLCRAHGRKEK
jgi:hypothetical protein